MSNEQTRPTGAMILAAGLGVRMRPVTVDKPKPLVEVAGRTLLDRALDRLADAGMEKVVVNVHYKGEMIREHLAKRKAPEIVYSDENDLLLETGGGIAKALPMLGGGPFVVVNSDVIWFDGWFNAINRMAELWDDAAMDVLLLLHPTVFAVGYSQRGDFNMLPDGRLVRRPEREVAPFVFAGVQLLHPRLFEGCPEGPFSMNVLFDKAIEEGRLFGTRHEGDWLHVGSKEELAEAEAFLNEV
jgi:MurNAc alpha-1-phosphate uridylyltransferase